jgi:hypothetical protein
VLSHKAVEDPASPSRRLQKQSSGEEADQDEACDDDEGGENVSDPWVTNRLDINGRRIYHPTD